jgi:thiamine pyrophosphate-dependent acetolactate synthase large subunit-like protein
MKTAEQGKTVVSGWGSDAIAALLRELGFEYIALNPGSSYRGLHDSIVNYLGNERPEILLCLHEEHAIAMGHGYAKVTDKPLLTAVHSQVGLMHATMAIYDAWVDRVPLVILGANGPIDARKRRAFRDWVHTTADNGALIRGYTKWDDQPGSIEAALESVLRANQIARSLPAGPTYVCFDVEMQERKLAAPITLPDAKRFTPPDPPVPPAHDVQRAAQLLRAAKHPVILVGRVSRSMTGWNERVALAEALQARVITDLKVGAAFPTDHPLHAGPPGGRLTKNAVAAVREADVILSLDFVDVGGSLREASGGDPSDATVISCSLDQYVHNGWSMDYQELPAVDLNLAGSPDAFVSALLREMEIAVAVERPRASVATNGARSGPPAGERIGVGSLCAAVVEACRELDTCFIRLPLGVDGRHFTFRHPLDYLGGSTGIGIGPGIAVGAALALRGGDRLPVAILGDGDYLMGVTALWTAVANKIPLLVVLANNRSYFNDEVHQGRMAQERGRPVERKWIGQRIDDPAPDLAGIARMQGAAGIGPVTRASELPSVLKKAIDEVRSGKVCIVDVIIEPEYETREQG